MEGIDYLGSNDPYDVDPDLSPDSEQELLLFDKSDKFGDHGASVDAGVSLSQETGYERLAGKISLKWGDHSLIWCQLCW